MNLNEKVLYFCGEIKGLMLGFVYPLTTDYCTKLILLGLLKKKQAKTSLCNQQNMMRLRDVYVLLYVTKYKLDTLYDQIG